MDADWDVDVLLLGVLSPKLRMGWTTITPASLQRPQRCDKRLMGDSGLINLQAQDTIYRKEK